MFKKVLLVGSALGLATILSMGVSNAQDQPTQPEKKMERSGDTDCANGQDCTQGGGNNRVEKKRQDNQAGDNDQDQGSSRTKKKMRANNEVGDSDQDQGSGRKKKKMRAETDQMDNQGDVKKNDRRREARSDWRYDPQRHHRSRHKDATYRFYLGGYYYSDRYWDEPDMAMSGRVSCGEGRRIVDDSGYSRVRTVECSGRTFTYMGRRHGDTFRIVLNSRNGRIVSVSDL